MMRPRRFEVEHIEMLSLLADQLEPTFGYMRGTGDHVGYMLFDVRPEICHGCFGFEHGDRVIDHDGGLCTAIGVAMNENTQLPDMWFHLDGRRGAGVFSNLFTLRDSFVRDASVAVDEVYLNNPIFAAGGNRYPDMAFSFDFEFISNINGEYVDKVKFDIRDKVVRLIAGFRHGQVVVNAADNRAYTVLGLIEDRYSGGRRDLWLVGEEETMPLSLEATRSLRATGRTEDLGAHWRHGQDSSCEASGTEEQYKTPPRFGLAEEEEGRDLRFWLANVAAAVLLADGARVLAKAELCGLPSGSPSLGLAVLPGVMVLNRMPYAAMVGLMASVHGFLLSPSKALESARAWPWTLVGAGCCAYLVFTKPGRFV